jgi:hypothetical protein
MHPKAVLALNEELRKDRRPFALPDHSGHVAFQMSTLEYFYWTMRIPDLAASDAQIARNAWVKFLNTDAGRRYKVNPTEGKRMPTDGVIVR